MPSEKGESPLPPLRDLALPKPNWKLLLGLVGGFAIVFALWSSAYTVEPEEVAVVLRFGRYVREESPGLRWKLPYPVESVRKVPVRRQLKAEYGFKTQSAGIRTTYSSGDHTAVSLMLTGDLNVADVQWVAQYRVSDPMKYLFKVRNLTTTFDDMNEAVMRQVIGDRSVNEVLTVGRAEIESEVKRILQDLCDKYEMGVGVESIVLQDVNPPAPVQASFNEVNQAQQERERKINDAQAEYQKVVPKAMGTAERTVQEAEGYAVDRVKRAQGDVEIFNQLLQVYRQAPEVTRSRLFLETMREVYPRVKETIVIDGELDSALPLLPLAGEGGR